jgi:hypothetical protein
VVFIFNQSRLRKREYTLSLRFITMLWHSLLQLKELFLAVQSVQSSALRVRRIALNAQNNLTHPSAWSGLAMSGLLC